MMIDPFSDTLNKSIELTNYKKFYLLGLVTINIRVSDRLPNAEYALKKYKQEISVNIFGREVFAFSIYCDRKGKFMIDGNELKDGAIIKRL